MAFVTKGQDYEILNITLSATVDTEVDPSASPRRRAKAFIIQCRTAVDMTIRRANNASQSFTIKSGTVLELDVALEAEQGIWIRATSGTPVAEVIAIY